MARALSLTLLTVLPLLLATSVPAAAETPEDLARYTGPGTIDISVPAIPPTLPADVVLVANLADPHGLRVIDLGGSFDGAPVLFHGHGFSNVLIQPGPDGTILVDFESLFEATAAIGGAELAVETRDPAPMSAVIFPDGSVQLDTTGPPVPLYLVGQMQPLGNVNGLVANLVEACRNGLTNLCMLSGRFRVEIDWVNQAGRTGRGRPVTSADRSGLFWFFADDNWEMLVKMLDACNSPFNSFWVFSAATTNVEYTLTVTDTDQGVMKQYTNDLGVSAPAVTDTAAFMTCR